MAFHELVCRIARVQQGAHARQSGREGFQELQLLRTYVGTKCISRMWGLKDDDVWIWRVTGVHEPAPFAFDPEEEAEAE
jgi:hypothetical protein